MLTILDLVIQYLGFLFSSSLFFFKIYSGIFIKTNALSRIKICWHILCKFCSPFLRTLIIRGPYRTFSERISTKCDLDLTNLLYFSGQMEDCEWQCRHNQHGFTQATTTTFVSRESRQSFLLEPKLSEDDSEAASKLTTIANGTMTFPPL